MTHLSRACAGALCALTCGLLACSGGTSYSTGLAGTPSGFGGEGGFYSYQFSGTTSGGPAVGGSRVEYEMVHIEGTVDVWRGGVRESRCTTSAPSRRECWIQSVSNLARQGRGGTVRLRVEVPVRVTEERCRTVSARRVCETVNVRMEHRRVDVTLPLTIRDAATE